MPTVPTPLIGDLVRVGDVTAHITSVTQTPGGFIAAFKPITTIITPPAPPAPPRKTWFQHLLDDDGTA